MAVAASRTRNPVLLVLILAVTGFVVAARRSDAAWASSYTAFLKLGLVVIGVRVVLQALLSTRSQGNTVLFILPQIPLPDWANGVKLGGEVTLEALLTALYDGFQLAVMLCCIGAANSLASPRRLLKSLPGALYEMGVACVVALTFAPQLVTDARRIRAARRLRGRTRGSFRTTAMPVLRVPWTGRWSSPPRWTLAATGVRRRSPGHSVVRLRSPSCWGCWAFCSGSMRC